MYIKIYIFNYFIVLKKLYYFALNYLHFYYYKNFGKNLFFLADVEMFT